MTRIDVMVDIETLGKDVDSTIFQIAAKTFVLGEEGNENLYEFNGIADIGLGNIPLNIDGNTLKWWLDTDKELLHELLQKGKDSPEHLITDFYSWLRSLRTVSSFHGVHLWGNGILFDNMMLKTQMEELGLGYPIYYRNDRDVRTFAETASFLTGKTEEELKDEVDTTGLVAHDAMDDVERQIRHVQHYYKEMLKQKEGGNL